VRVLLLFLDGIGLGDPDPTYNPFAAAHLPTLQALSNGLPWLRSTPITSSERAIFLPIDPRLGIGGRPQSATGQAAILTGRNVPAEIGEHYGPYPTPAIRQIIAESSLFKRLTEAGKRAAYLCAYPPNLHASIARGKRLRTALQQAAYEGGVGLPTVDDLRAGQALSGDITNAGWHEILGYTDVPVLTPFAAGQQMAALASQYDFSLFTTWITDEIGHRGPLEKGVQYLESFDQCMAGLLSAWRDEEGLIILTSDHGNLEDLRIRQHTESDVPTLLVGAGRQAFAEGFSNLAQITPRILQALGF
jgi:2,3-bisphosphoglycerate-independent phosphoglycerate mutase